MTLILATRLARSSELKVNDRLLENLRYRVTLNDAGDIAGIFDKSAHRELLDSPARLAILSENLTNFPAWNMDWNDRANPPRSYVGGVAKIRIVEHGPVRVAIEVERQAENSVFIQTIRLAAGAAGDRVEVANHVAWQGRACSLKAEFPLSVTNPLATYNWEIGKIQRGNNDPKKYEVPSHGWFDLTDAKKDYGVSVLTDSKYGSDKPNDHTLRLTLLYTPGVRENSDYYEQRYQDWGRHEFTYALQGHRGDWRSGKADWEAARLSQPLQAFRTVPHSGKLGRTFSLLRTSSDQIAMRTMKLAEESDKVVVRLQELHGFAVSAVELQTSKGLAGVTEINGVEQVLQPVASSGKKMMLDFKPYQIRSLACDLKPPLTLSPSASMSVELPYNLDVFSFNEAKSDGACDEQGATIPAEMISDTVVSEGINFKIGPRENGKQNAVSCDGQKLTLPDGDFNQVYLLAMAVYGDTDGTFTLDERTVTLRIQDWSGFIGGWDTPVFQGNVEQLTYSIKNPLERIDAGFTKRDPLAWFCSHRHQRDGSDQAYTYCYLFKYRIDVSPGTKAMTLPVNPRICVLAVTAARDENVMTQPAVLLYDDFSHRLPLVLHSSH
ncbi:MAG: glycosyl hydrolase 38-like protein [Pedosphaera sp.]|nr:glycosyl hydrolase 38-like protein [Pedosphaera sp.]